MTRWWWIALGVAGALAAGAAIQQVQKDRQYRGLLAVGEQNLAGGDPSAAVESFSGALALRPASMVCHFRRSAAYRALGRRDDAIRDLREAIRLAPESTAPFIALGEIYEADEDWVRTADAYGQAAARLTDQDPPLLYKLAVAQYRAGRPAAAIDPLQRAIARDDSMAPAHYLLGVALRDTQRLDEATQALERAVKVAPSMRVAHEELADLYRARNRPVDELVHLQALAALDETSAARVVAVALVLVRTGQYDGAIAALTTAAAAHPGDGSVQLALARAHLTRGEREADRASVRAAVAVLEPLAAAARPSSETLALLGRARYLLGDFTGSEHTLRDATAVVPATVESFAFLADTAERLGHDTFARDALLNLDALQGDTATAPQRAARAGRLGSLSMRAGDYSAASTYFGRAVDSGLGDAATWGLLARARWQNGDRSGAKDALQHALGLAPGSADLLQLARTIR